MARWTWAVGPWRGDDPTRQLTAATERKLTFRRREGATAEFKIDGRHPEAAEIHELATDLHAYRAGKRLFRGRVAGTKDDVDTETHTVDATVGDYRNVIERRKIFDGDPVLGAVWSVDAAELVGSLLDLTQGRAYGALGIVRGAGFPELGRTTPAVEFTAGQAIGAAVELFAGTDPATTGFDWEIDGELRLNLWAGARGEARGVVLDYGGNVAGFSRTVDPGGYGNAGRWSGWPGETIEVDDVAVFVPGPAPVVLTAGDLDLRPEGRWEDQRAYPEIRSAGLLAERAARDLEEMQTIRPGYTVRTAPGWWQGPGHVWLGDPVRFRAKTGRLNVLADYRVEEITITLSNEGDETVEIELGAGFPGFDRRLAAAEDRLRLLSRI